jgi:hypothetical protein
VILCCRAANKAHTLDHELLVDLYIRDLELDEQWSFAGLLLKKPSSGEKLGGTRALHVIAGYFD